MHIIRHVFHAFGLPAAAAMNKAINVLKLLFQQLLYYRRKGACGRKQQFADMGF
jgi:hypothetical protein